MIAPHKQNSALTQAAVAVENWGFSAPAVQ